MTTTFNATTIDVERFRQLRQSAPDTRILDVRTGGEFESVHIPGSYNVPLDTLAEHAHELAHIEEPVVLVCQTGARASKAQSTLGKAGKDQLMILDGGIAGWQAADGELARGTSDRWAMDRQVRLVAGSLVLAGVAASTMIPGAKWLAGGVGAGLTFSAVSNTCAMASLLGRLPYNRSNQCDIEGVLAELRGQGA